LFLGVEPKTKFSNAGITFLQEGRFYRLDSSKDFYKNKSVLAFIDIYIDSFNDVNSTNDISSSYFFAEVNSFNLPLIQRKENLYQYFAIGNQIKSNLIFILIEQ
jgi:hypothetical protein